VRSPEERKEGANSILTEEEGKKRGREAVSSNLGEKESCENRKKSWKREGNQPPSSSSRKKGGYLLWE